MLFLLSVFVVGVFFSTTICSLKCSQDPECMKVGNITESRAILMKLITESEINCFKSGKCPNKNATTLKNQRVNCQNGYANEFPCENVDILSITTIADLGSGSEARGNDIWGWTDPTTNKLYAITGQTDGTSFVDVTDPLNPIVLGFLKSNAALLTTWRDMKVFNNHAYIVADDRANGHGMQVFDLTRLRTMSPNTIIDPSTIYTYYEFGSCHNIYINEDTGYLYAIGSKTCQGGLHMVDLNNNPNGEFAGCYSDDGYTHDVECVIFHGDDTRYTGKELCFAYNEDTLTVVDVTDKSSPQLLSRTGYVGSAYCHQGWLTEDHNYLLMDDELDEIYDSNGMGGHSRTMIWEIKNINDPQLIGNFYSSQTAVDHNLYILNNFAYQSNDGAGLRILNLDNIAQGDLTEIAYFDAYPEATLPEFQGVWSGYPYYSDSNEHFIVIMSRDRGLFVLQPNIV